MTRESTCRSFPGFPWNPSPVIPPPGLLNGRRGGTSGRWLIDFHLKSATRGRSTVRSVRSGRHRREHDAQTVSELLERLLLREAEHAERIPVESVCPSSVLTTSARAKRLLTRAACVR